MIYNVKILSIVLKIFPFFPFICGSKSFPKKEEGWNDTQNFYHKIIGESSKF